LIALWFPAGLFACLTWLGAAFFFRFSSLSALIAASAAPFIMFSMGKPAYAFATLAMTIIIFIRHKDNIKRLLAGDEPKIGASKTT